MLPLCIMEVKDPNNRAMMHQLYEKHDRKLFRQSYAITRNNEDAEDAMQDVWVSLCSEKSLQKLKVLFHKPSCELQMYLAKVVYNKSIDVCRKRQSYKTIEAHYAQNEMSQVRHMLNQGERRLELEAEVQTVMNAMVELSPVYRMYIQMSIFEEKKNKEIANILGKTENSVRATISLAKKSLLKILTQIRTGDENE